MLLFNNFLLEFSLDNSLLNWEIKRFLDEMINLSKMKKLHVTLIQKRIVWENPEQNIRDTTQIINTVGKTDLVVLPEMFVTGFTFRTALAETMQGRTVMWMKETAAAGGFALAGSLMIEENGLFYNRFLFVHPDGQIDSYDKRHLFSFAGEDRFFEKGNARCVVNYRGWRILPFICYDLRFPVWLRCRSDYDLLLCVANWPDSRIVAWDTLLKARAIENISYCVGVTITGTDGNGLEYSGHSAVFDYFGKKIAYADAHEQVLQAALSLTDLAEARTRFPALSDTDDFTLNG